MVDGLDISARTLDDDRARGTFSVKKLAPGWHSIYVRVQQEPTDGAVDLAWSSPVFIEVGK